MKRHLVREDGINGLLFEDNDIPSKNMLLKTLPGTGLDSNIS